MITIEVDILWSVATNKTSINRKHSRGISKLKKTFNLKGERKHGILKRMVFALGNVKQNYRVAPALGSSSLGSTHACPAYYSINLLKSS